MKRVLFYTMMTLVVTFAIFSLQCQRDKNPAGSNIEEQPPVQTIETISAAQAKTFIDENIDNSDFVIIDIRTPGEYISEHIEDAINIDFYDPEFETLINQLDKSKIYLIYCRSGSRSGQALTIMESSGFITVYNLDGGITAWKNAGYMVVV